MTYAFADRVQLITFYFVVSAIHTPNMLLMFHVSPTATLPAFRHAQQVALISVTIVAQWAPHVDDQLTFDSVPNLYCYLPSPSPCLPPTSIWLLLVDSPSSTLALPLTQSTQSPCSTNCPCLRPFHSFVPRTRAVRVTSVLPPSPPRSSPRRT